MTAGELVRYNLARLVAASKREIVDVAMLAWPMPERKTVKLWRVDSDVRRRRLARLLAEPTDDGHRSRATTPTLEVLDDLARALGCKLTDFFREPN